MKFRTNEMGAVDKIVAACDGNVHGALEVLLLLNEHLEAEIQQLYTTLSRANPGHSLLVGAQH
jgi:hypothetical protein